MAEAKAKAEPTMLRQALNWAIDTIIEAADPIIREHERQRLRTQVESLPDEHVYDPRLGSCVRRADVLALLDGSSE